MAGRIVVGVDGSDTSLAALRWALHEAELRGAALTVVHAWQHVYMGGIAGLAAYSIPQTELEQDAQIALDRAIKQAGPAPAGVDVTPILTEGKPATVLIDAAHGADLLVVGSRGHGGFAGLLMGSVSQQCAHHAPCPIVIVPTAEAVHGSDPASAG